MPQDSSTVVFIVFGVVVVCVLLALFMLISDWFLPLSNCIIQFFSRFKCFILKSFRFSKANLNNIPYDSYSNADDISEDASKVLAMLNSPTIVIDSENDVIRASFEAYMLGVVADDDSIVQPKVIRAVNSVRSSGTCERFNLVTSTPDRYIDVQDNVFSLEHDSYESRDNCENCKTSVLSTVTRPNWLNITVGSIGNGLIVVIIEDTSAAHRFAQTREDFISNVSDQLISSTRMISNLTKVLQFERVSDVSEEKIKNIAALANKSSKRLEHMLEDLLLLISAQDPINPNDSSILSVKDIIDEVKNQVVSLAKNCCVKIRVQSESSLKVLGYENQICTAIRKLVENAIVYSHKNGVVSIKTSVSGSGKYALIKVVDCGVGIPLCDQSRIFERFYRSSNQNDNSQDGVGLGLAIAKHVALTHNGWITLWSKPNQGTTVNFVLPIAPIGADLL